MKESFSARDTIPNNVEINGTVSPRIRSPVTPSNFQNQRALGFLGILNENLTAVGSP
jgi:hypothetical protein